MDSGKLVGAVATASAPISAFYDATIGEHHHGSDIHEHEALLGCGCWNDKGVGWYALAAE